MWGEHFFYALLCGLQRDCYFYISFPHNIIVCIDKSDFEVSSLFSKRSCIWGQGMWMRHLQPEATVKVGHAMLACSWGTQRSNDIRIIGHGRGMFGSPSSTCHRWCPLGLWGWTNSVYQSRGTWGLGSVGTMGTFHDGCIEVAEVPRRSGLHSKNREAKNPPDTVDISICRKHWFQDLKRKYSHPSVSMEDRFQDNPHRYQNLKMLKSLILN